MIFLTRTATALTAERLAALKMLSGLLDEDGWALDGVDVYALISPAAKLRTKSAIAFASNHWVETLDGVEALIARIEELEAQVPRWIPVEERLPTEADANAADEVLVLHNQGDFMNTAPFGTVRQERHKAWMLLPDREEPHA